MLNTTNANIKLTAEQSLQILEWQQRLSVIQNEINIAEKNVQTVKEEVETRTRHNNYLEEEGIKFEAKNKELAATKELLEEEVRMATIKLSEHGEEMRSRSLSLQERESKTSAIEADVAVRHTDLSSKEEEHHKKSLKLSERELLVEKAQKAFLKAAESVTWKS